VSATTVPPPPRTGTYTEGAPLLRYLLPSTLRELASVIEYRQSQSSALRKLTLNGREALVDLLMAGHTPTVGWFLRNTQEETP
jgi:hypothetical protein